jgi:hypothetical protein
MSGEGQTTTTDSGQTGDGTGNGTGTETGKPAAGTEFQPITTQEDLNKVIGERVARERAKYADYDDLRQKAEAFDEAQRANMSEADRLKAEAEQARKDAEEARTESLRWRVAAKHGVSDEDAKLFLTGTDEETLTQQAKRIQTLAEGRQRGGMHVPREGENNGGSLNDGDRATVRTLFGND